MTVFIAFNESYRSGVKESVKRLSYRARAETRPASEPTKRKSNPGLGFQSDMPELMRVHSMIDERRSLGIISSSNCFHTCAALNSVFFIVFMAVLCELAECSQIVCLSG
jgi:hypothetical protein